MISNKFIIYLYHLQGQIKVLKKLLINFFCLITAQHPRAFSTLATIPCVDKVLSTRTRNSLPLLSLKSSNFNLVPDQCKTLQLCGQSGLAVLSPTKVQALIHTAIICICIHPHILPPCLPHFHPLNHL